MALVPADGGLWGYSAVGRRALYFGCRCCAESASPTELDVDLFVGSVRRVFETSYGGLREVCAVGRFASYFGCGCCAVSCCL